MSRVRNTAKCDHGGIPKVPEPTGDSLKMNSELRSPFMAKTNFAPYHSQSAVLRVISLTLYRAAADREKGAKPLFTQKFSTR